MVTVTKTWASGNTLTATDANANYDDMVTAFSAGTEDYSVANVTMAASLTAASGVSINTGSQFPQMTYSFYQPSQLEWVDTETIKVKAGNFNIDGAVYPLSSDLSWDWTASGAGRGLATGVSEATSTWFYLYAIAYQNALGVVGTTSAPSQLMNNALSYDTKNLYLGAFYNNVDEDVVAFVQNGNDFRTATNVTLVHTLNVSHTSYTALELYAPPITEAVWLFRYKYRNVVSNDGWSYLSYDGTNDYHLSRCEIWGNSAQSLFRFPVNASNTVYFKDSHPSTGSAVVENYLYIRGWVDKHL